MADLEARDLTKSYPTRGEPLVVLRGVSLELNRGENAAILGPSGCGKSTLLQILGTLDRPTSGSYRFQETEPFRFDEPKLAAFRNQQIGFVFQDHHLLAQCTALENVLLPVIAQGNATPEQTARATDLMKRVGLADRLDHRPGELSGGERQRTAIARALINRPTLLLADEPTGNLDRKTADVVASLLLDLQKEENTMLIVVTHAAELAERFSRRIEMVDGLLEG
jgi:lipoprotein-releasing system ATP-binding protein